jgi:hypothetical protein
MMKGQVRRRRTGTRIFLEPESLSGLKIVNNRSMIEGEGKYGESRMEASIRINYSGSFFYHNLLYCNKFY